MADYVGNYQFDLGIQQPCLLLKTYLIENGTLVTRTSYSFDADYLPLVFLNNVAIKNSVKTSCSVSFRPRRVHLYLDELTFLSVQLPFMPTSPNYVAFMAAVKANSAIIAVKTKGEKISSIHTVIWSNG